MIIVIGEMQLKSGAYAKFDKALNELLPKSRADDGNISYEFARDIQNPDLIRFAERWRDKAAFDAHNAQPHMTQSQLAVGPLLAGTPVIDVYEAG